jgi:class 3 adenylate cyclase
MWRVRRKGDGFRQAAMHRASHKTAGKIVALRKQIARHKTELDDGDARQRQTARFRRTVTVLFADPSGFEQILFDGDDVPHNR